MKWKKLKYLVLIIALFLVVNKISAEGLPAGEYKVGDLVTYNNIKFYVIENSDKTSDFVTLLKKEPLNATM